MGRFAFFSIILGCAMHNFSNHLGPRHFKNMAKHEERQGLVRVLGEVAGKSGVARVHTTAGMPKVTEMMNAIRGASCPRATLAKAETTYKKYAATRG